MREITSEQHGEATVSLGTYCSVCACTRVCDTGWCCVTVAYRVPEPRGNVSSLKRSEAMFEKLLQVKMLVHPFCLVPCVCARARARVCVYCNIRHKVSARR